ncbi:MFS transporter [Corynebacterium epidermidicanis]|uniref:Nitrate/nitrite transporter n=1 Tax=Corynebacterium epidermidicanis TaxID=1050174 RepID=A0A0G3GVL7_9CORY|nr:MFS transporter [Corynebacterium epidermidicanis]AKK03588.1 nitrate/nitrite transporter [Corynebacterium epidermidicanis]
MPHNPREQLTTQALLVWTGAMLVYVVAIAGRTSLGVAGVEALEHFHINNSKLAVFTAVQLGVYALAQIPMGMAIDKFGARRVLVVGAIVMGLGQVLLGSTSSFWVAILARILVGAGDATAFLSVMRILPTWFPMRLTPLFTQLTSAMGQAGQFISAVPFLALLGATGWQTAFVSLGAAGILIGLSALVLVTDSPLSAPTPPATTPSRLGEVLRNPVCWMGLFNHGLMLMPLIVFTLLWGMPLMTLGMGLDESVAASVLVINTICNVIIGPFHGVLSARSGRNREFLTMALATVILLSFLWFFASPTPRGFLSIAIISGLLGALGPAANYGFDSVRENLPHSVVTTGTGLSNMGGFTAAMLAAQGIGLLLDHHAESIPNWQDFAAAWFAVYAVWAFAMLGLVLSRRAFTKRYPGAHRRQG